MPRNGKFGVGILIDAQNRVTGPAERAARSMMVLGRDVAASGRIIQASMQSAAGGLAVFTAGFKALKGLFGVANEAGKFTQEMAAVQSIIGATGQEFKKLEKTALEAGLSTQFSPLQASNTMRALAQAGLTAKDAMKALRPALDLSAASLGKLAPERAAQTLNSTLKTFQLGANQSRMAMNSLVNATNRYNISIQDLPIGIGNISRGAKALNQDMDSTLAVLGLTKNVLPQISSAATLTSSAMLRVADATVQKKLKALGVTFQDQKGKFLPIISIFNNLNNVLKNKYSKEVDRAAMVTKLLGKRAIAPFAAVTAQLEKGVPVAARLAKGMKGVTFSKDGSQAILKGSQAIKFLQLQFKAARGEVNAIPKDMIGLRKEALRIQKEAGKGRGVGDLFVQKLLGTFRGQVVLLKGAWQSFLIAVGKPLISVFKPFVSLMFVGLGKITKFIIGLNKGFKEFIARLGFSATLSTMLVGAVLAIKAAFVFLKPVLLATLAPILKIVAVAALLVLAAEAIRMAWMNNLLGIRTVVLSVWAGVKKGFNEFVGPISTQFLPFLRQAFVEMFSSIRGMLVSFGLISAQTTGQLSSTWMEVGRIIFHVFGFFIKAIVLSIAGVAKLISWVANLAGWFGWLGGKVTGFFGGVLGFGGAQAKIPKRVFLNAQGQVVKTLSKSGTDNGSNIPTQARTPIGAGNVKPPTTQNIFQQRSPFTPNAPQNNQGIPLQASLMVNGNKLGELVFGQQKQNQARGLVRTTVKEQ